MFARVSAISFCVVFLGFAHSAIACSPSLEAFQNRPKLEQILATHSTVFVGTVVDSGGPTTKVMVGSPPQEVTVQIAKFKVEIPIRGGLVEVFEVLNGGGSDCSNEFKVGQRWLFAGTSLGSYYFDGSTMIVDQRGDVREVTNIVEIPYEEIVKMYPEVETLPPPSIVVQDFLKGK